MDFPEDDFASFTAADCDRYSFLCAQLEKRRIESSTIELDGKKHIYINFPSTAYNAAFRVKTMLVHYDRAEHTPGANDNSAAVFQTLDFIERLAGMRSWHNMRIFFTDGEELGAGSGVSEQGAFSIAARFKKLGITNDSVFVFDGCGRGDILVISTAGRKNGGSHTFYKSFEELYGFAAGLARSVSPEKWVTLPVPYSDNAGFIASGIPALAVTVLPAEEATRLMHDLQRDPSFENVILSNVSSDKLPETWRLMHTAGDTPDTLTPAAFVLMARFFDALAAARIPRGV